jgi:hypothetical protein
MDSTTFRLGFVFLAHNRRTVFTEYYECVYATLMIGYINKHITHGQDKRPVPTVHDFFLIRLF